MSPTEASRPNSSPQDRAERVVSLMFGHDAFSRWLGVEIVKIEPARVTTRMTVRAEMLNGFHVCHGGVTFAFADSAFAFACNSYNLTTVASGCTIEFVAPARENDVLTAVAQERSVSGRTGVYDIEVTNQDGAAIAFFRGKSYRIKGHVLDAANRTA